MKISNNNGIDPYQKVGLSEISTHNKVDKQEELHASTIPTQDTVSLSEDAKYHAVAKLEAQNAPDVRESKVARLKEMVANGTYTFNSMDTARAMVKDIFADRSLLLMN